MTGRKHKPVVAYLAVLAKQLLFQEACAIHRQI
jgi:hypothetical protein